MRMRSQRDMRSMLSKAALKSTNAMYNVRLCSLHCCTYVFGILLPRRLYGGGGVPEVFLVSVEG